MIITAKHDSLSKTLLPTTQLNCQKIVWQVFATNKLKQMWIDGEVIPGIEKLTPEDVILVTGGTGLFGCAVRDIVARHKLVGKWVFLGSKDGDLRVLADVEKLFALHKPTYVIHLAAFVGGLFRNMKMKVQFWYDNVNMNNNVLACANKAQVRW